VDTGKCFLRTCIIVEGVCMISKWGAIRRRCRFRSFPSSFRPSLPTSCCSVVHHHHGATTSRGKRTRTQGPRLNKQHNAERSAQGTPVSGPGLRSRTARRRGSQRLRMPPSPIVLHHSPVHAIMRVRSIGLPVCLPPALCPRACVHACAWGAGCSGGARD
jgi:hypothetical protein